MKSGEAQKNLDRWAWEEARHLLNRSGFGGQPAEIERFVGQGFATSLAELFEFPGRRLEAPSWLSEYDSFSPLDFRSLSRQQRQEFMQQNRKHVHDLQLTWIQRMIESPTPADMLWEKMSFFWHGHFATSFQKVKLAPLLFGQRSLFHKHAIGNFRDLLHGIARDPAMLRYLDNNQNRKGKPNENFARELMELFSLGPGHYSEEDIKEAARAFTGWTNDPFRFRIRPRQHDYGEKTFLGRTANLDGNDIVDIILEQPACAEFITRKLLAFFAFRNASDEMVHTLAEAFLSADYELAPLLKMMLAQPGFYASENIGVQIKSPVQLLVGTARTLGVNSHHPLFYLRALEMMEQAPYFPPNVKGWPGGRSWIDTSRLLSRYTFAEIISRGEIPQEVDPRSAQDPDRKAEHSSGFVGKMARSNMRIEFEPEHLLEGVHGVDNTIARLESVLLSHPLTAEERATLERNFDGYRKEKSQQDALRALIGDIMTLPAYQLC